MSMILFMTILNCYKEDSPSYLMAGILGIGRPHIEVHMTRSTLLVLPQIHELTFSMIFLMSCLTNGSKSVPRIQSK